MTKTAKIFVAAALGVAVAAVVALRNIQHSSQAQQYGVVAMEAGTTEALPRLVDLGSDKCRACKMMEPVLETLQKEYSDKLKVEFIDVFKDMDAGRAYGVQIIPTQIFFDRFGKELYRHEGFLSKQDILSRFKELGITLTEEAK
jgi:thioredoxin 1